MAGRRELSVSCVQPWGSADVSGHGGKPGRPSSLVGDGQRPPASRERAEGPSPLSPARQVSAGNSGTTRRFSDAAGALTPQMTREEALVS